MALFLFLQQTEISPNWITAAQRHFAARRAEKPATKASQSRALWPEIKAALAGGQSMKTIREWLEEDAGVTLSLTSLTSYISRIRRRELRQSVARPASALETQPDESTETAIRPSKANNVLSCDPLASAMAVLRQRRFDIREVHGDGDPRDKNLI